MKIKPIDWSGEIDSNSECGYTHAIGTTPLGKFLITWKGWKDDHCNGMSIDENPIGHPDIESSDVARKYAKIYSDAEHNGLSDLDFTKLICQGEYERVVLGCLDSEKTKDDDEVLRSWRGRSILRIDELEKRIDGLEKQRVEGIGLSDEKVLKRRVDNWVKEEMLLIEARDSIVDIISDGIMRFISAHYTSE